MTVNNDRKLKLIWSSDLIYDYSNRGLIKFYTKHEFIFIKEYSSFLDYLEKSLIYEYSLICILIISLSIFQVVIIIKRFYSGFKALLEIKMKLEEEGDHDLDDSFIQENQGNDYLYNSPKNKWEMLQLNEKRKFFNLWYIVIIISNLFQIISSANYILYPILNNTNQILCATSCFFTWFGCGYFLEYEEKYYFFYLTIKKSIKTHFKYIVVFVLIFLGYGILLASAFNYSENFYSNIHMAFITNFAGLVSDNLAATWRSTYSNDPMKTFLFSLFYFLAFVAFLMRMMTTITEESFDCVKMRKNYHWLDRKLSVRDYLRHEAGHKEDEEKGSKDSGNESHYHNHYLMSNAVMNILLLMEKKNNQIPSDFEKVFSLRINQLKKGGLDDEAVIYIVKKELRNLLKSSNKRKSSRDTSDKEIDLFELKLGKTESVKMKYVHELVEGIINFISNSLNKIEESNKLQQNKFPFNKKEKEKILAFYERVLVRLAETKRILSNS